ncbi:MAG TPA: hypothetical protein VGI10_06410 [Polyangiaceae bacterium]|jgi:hypothetical protein
MPSLRPLEINPADIKVKPQHLKELGKIQDLLRALNDPYAAGQSVERLVEKIPILAARCLNKAISRSTKIQINSLDHAIRLIGNRGLEGVLLELLEDLTIAKSQMDSK